MADKNFIPSPSSPPPDMSLPVVREIIEMRLCEASHVVLHPDRLYRFSVAPGCRSCEMEAGIIPRPVIPASRAPGGPFPRTVTCAWCGNRYRSSCPGDMDVGLQGSHCASDVVREDDKWVVRCGYGSENDMNKYAFVTNPPSEPADPVCDECVDQRLIMGDLVEITPECYRTARTLGDYSPRPPGTRGLVARIRHHMENEVAMRGLIDAAVRASEVGHPEFDDVGHLELDAAVSEYRRYQRWIGELDDGGETYAEGAPEVATQMREVARQLEQLAVFWERKGARPTAGSPTPVSPPPGS